MIYIENIYICLAAPLIIALLCIKGPWRRLLIALLSGMTMCLLSSYINSYLAASAGVDTLTTAVEIAPTTEELMKLLPVFLYLITFDPPKEKASESMLLTAIGFATFENVCYLTTNGASGLVSLLIRGFGTGAMHVVCGMIVSVGLLHMWDRLYLRVAGTAGIMAIAITYHGIYNMLVMKEGYVAWIGFMIPAASAVIMILFRNAIYGKIYDQDS